LHGANDSVSAFEAANDATDPSMPVPMYGHLLNVYA
jgi:hypothetical protein